MDQNVNSRWVDVESELAKYSRSGSHAEFHEEYKLLKQSLMEYIQKVKIVPDASSPAYKMVFAHHQADAKVISFNYTNSFEVVLSHKPGHDPAHLSNIQYIHGTARGNDIIFGVDDSASIIPEHVFLRKSTSLLYNGRNIAQLLISADVIHFFGHSLGESDHMYFKEFFTRGRHGQIKDKEIIFYPYGEQGHNDLHAQLHSLTDHSVSQLKNHNDVKFVDSSK